MQTRSLSADSVETIALLDDLAKLSLQGLVPIGNRVSLSLEAPLFLRSVWNGESSATQLGDLRLGVPLALLRPGSDHLGAGLIPELLIPTGNSDHFLGTNQWSGALLGFLGQRLDRFEWGLNLGADLSPGDTASSELDPSLKRVLNLRASASAGWAPLPWLGLGLEAWAFPTLSENAGAAPAEILGRVGLQLPEGFQLSVGAGRALNNAAGSAAFRGIFRLSWNAAPPPVTPTPVVETPPPPPPTFSTDLRVKVTDEHGQSIDAQLKIADNPPQAIGPDGEETVHLPPGLWQIELSAAGRETQRRVVAMQPDAWRPVELLAVLPPAENGDGSLHLELLDLSGAPVAGVHVAIDGSERGATANGGTLDLLGLRPGERTVSLDAADYQPVAPLTLTMGPAELSRRVYLARPPGSLRILAHAPHGTVADAMVRLEGPTAVPPTALGESGEHSFVLAPGTWEVVLSAPQYGLQEREVVITPDSPPQDLEFILAAEEQGLAELLIRVVDPDGNPVAGASVQMDGHALGSTGSGGDLKISGLQPGTRTISVSGDHFRPAEPRAVVLIPGMRETRFILGWKPGSVQVVAHGPEGSLLDAQVRWVGPIPVPDSSLGPDGRAFFNLQPGNWELVLSSAAYGLQERDVQVRPDDQQLIEIDAGLLRSAGSASLLLTLLNPEDTAAEGVTVQIDGQNAGETANGGTLRLEGLAPGPHRLQFSGGLYAAASQNFSLQEGENPLSFHLPWAPARLLLRAQSPSGPATDALVRLMGQENLPPVPVNSRGEHLFPVDPGHWTAIASSQTYGLGEVEVDLKAAPTVQTLEIPLSPPTPELADLLVEVVGPDGAPVQNLLATVDGKTVEGTAGQLLLRRLPVQNLHLSLSAPGYDPLPDQQIPLVAGSQERRLRMHARPRPFLLQVRDGKGQPVNASVQLLSGADRLKEQLGSDGEGRWALRPGTWHLLVSGDHNLEAREETILLEPGEETKELTLQLQAARVELTQKAVIIREQVFFSLNGATIEERSFPVLAEVAATLRLHPELTLVEVQGHTDTVGEEAYNLDLSQRRADAVRDWLLRAGVAPERLVAKGYGTSRPLGSNRTEAGRQQNRRVQFEVQKSELPPP